MLFNFILRLTKKPVQLKKEVRLAIAAYFVIRMKEQQAYRQGAGSWAAIGATLARRGRAFMATTVATSTSARHTGNTPKALTRPNWSPVQPSTNGAVKIAVPAPRAIRLLAVP